MQKLFCMILLLSCRVGLAQQAIAIVPPFAHRTLYLVDCKEQAYIVVVKINKVSDIRKIKIFTRDNNENDFFRDMIVYSNNLKMYFDSHKKLNLDSLCNFIMQNGVIGLELSTDDNLYRTKNAYYPFGSVTRMDMIRYTARTGVLAEFMAECAFADFYFYRDRNKTKKPTLFPIIYAPDASPYLSNYYRGVFFLENKQLKPDSANGVLAQCIPLNNGNPTLPIYDSSYVNSPIQDFAWEDSTWWLTSSFHTWGTLQWAAGVRPDSLFGYPRSFFASDSIPLFHRLFKQELLDRLKYITVPSSVPVWASYPYHINWALPYSTDKHGYNAMAILFKGALLGDTSRNFSQREQNSHIVNINKRYYASARNYYDALMNEYSIFYNSSDSLTYINCNENSFIINMEKYEKIYEIIKNDFDFLNMNMKESKVKYKIYYFSS